MNLRPIRLLEGVETPLANKTPADIDFVVVRENTEDFYVGIGSRFKKHQKIELEVAREIYNVKFGLDVESDAEELAYQIGVVTREGSRRVQTYAFELAREAAEKTYLGRQGKCPLRCVRALAGRLYGNRKEVS